MWTGWVCVITQRPHAALCTHHWAFADTCVRTGIWSQLVMSHVRDGISVAGARHSQGGGSGEGCLQPEAALFSNFCVLMSHRQETTPMGRTDSVLRVKVLRAPECLSGQGHHLPSNRKEPGFPAGDLEPR